MAYNLFRELDDYRDSKTYFDRFAIVPIKKTVARTLYNDVLKTFTVQITYDEQGRLAQITSDHTTNHIASAVDYVYDANGNVIKETTTHRKGGQTILDYTYDANQNLIKEVYTYSNGAQQITDYTYDANQNLIKEVWTDSDGKQRICDYTYDANNFLLKQAIKYSDDSQGTYDYLYDIYGNQIKQTYTPYDASYQHITFSEYDANGNCLVSGYMRDYPDDSKYEDYSHRKEYTYDEKGNLLQYLQFTDSKITDTINYTYDANGNLIKKTRTPLSGGSSTWEYTYNEAGLLIKEVSTYNTGKPQTYEYTYDKNGNLIKKTRIYFSNSNEKRTSFTDYTYDVNGNRIKEVYVNFKNEQIGITEYTYDEYGILIHQFTSEPSGDFPLITYDYQLVYREIEISEDMEELIEDYLDDLMETIYVG